MNQSGSSLIEMLVAITVLGIAITGTYDGLVVANRPIVNTLRSIDAQTIAEQAALLLENLPDGSAALADDGDKTDLYDLATPDKTVHPIDGGAWIVSAGPTAYRVFYNVVRDVKIANMAEIHIVVAWGENGSAPPLPVHTGKTIQKTIMRRVAPL